MDDESALGLVPWDLQHVHAHCVRAVSDHDLDKAAVAFGACLHVLKKDIQHYRVPRKESGTDAHGFLSRNGTSKLVQQSET